MAEEAMMEHVQDVRGALRAAPGVTITRLPFGGAVLVDGRTLALLECAEPDAVLLDALVARPCDRPGRGGEMDAVLARMASRLVDDGWLVPARNGGE
jgi:hypothetical protein